MKQRCSGARIAAVAAFLVLAARPAMAADAPRRVVSMNLCTDQMAMLLAGDDQLYSVSYMASDAGSSVMAAQAGSYVINHGLAEEIFLMQPDLVIAGSYTTRTTVDLLKRLGFRVEEFHPENSFDDIRANVERMGEILGRKEKASELIARLDAGLAELKSNKPPERTVALYYANSYASGSGTLADAIVKAAGLKNIGDTLGFTGTVKLPLELLVLAAPDLIVAGDRDHETPALAQENYLHPAFRALARDAHTVSVPSKYMICGAPFTLEAARILQEAAMKSAGDSQ